MSELRALALVALAVSGCSSDTSVEFEPTITVRFDGELVAALPHSALGIEPRALEQLLDGAAGQPAAWVSVAASAPDARQLIVHDLAFHADEGVYLRLDASATPEIGLFPRDDPAGRGPRLLLAGPLEVHVRTTPPPRPPPPPPPLAGVLEVRIEGGEPIALSEERLAAIATFGDDAPARVGSGAGPDEGGGGGGGRADGATLRREHHLHDVVAAVVAPRVPLAVTVVSQDGRRIEVAGANLRSREGAVPLLKRNKRGAWVFQLLGPTAGPDDRLRAVATLEVRLQE